MTDISRPPSQQGPPPEYARPAGHPDEAKSPAGEKRKPDVGLRILLVGILLPVSYFFGTVDVPGYVPLAFLALGALLFLLLMRRPIIGEPVGLSDFIYSEGERLPTAVAFGWALLFALAPLWLHAAYRLAISNAIPAGIVAIALILGSSYHMLLVYLREYVLPEHVDPEFPLRLEELLTNYSTKRLEHEKELLDAAEMQVFEAGTQGEELKRDLAQEQLAAVKAVAVKQLLLRVGILFAVLVLLFLLGGIGSVLLIAGIAGAALRQRFRNPDRRILVFAASWQAFNLWFSSPARALIGTAIAAFATLVCVPNIDFGPGRATGSLFATLAGDDGFWPRSYYTAVEVEDNWISQFSPIAAQEPPRLKTHRSWERKWKAFAQTPGAWGAIALATFDDIPVMFALLTIGGLYIIIFAPMLWFIALLTAFYPALEAFRACAILEPYVAGIKPITPERT